MRTLHPASLALLTLLAAPVSLAQTPPETAQLCKDNLTSDVQGNFSDSNGSLEISNSSFDVIDKTTPKPRLQLNTNLTALNTERITFPFTQNVTVSYVYESAGASHALGYMYLDDLRLRGYVNAAGALLDNNGNGVFDLHEDIYNLAPASGPDARPYIGLTRRCTRTFTSGGRTYTQPEIAMNANCDDSFTGDNRTTADARPGFVRTYLATTDLVGRQLRTAWDGTEVAGTDDFSDGGLFNHIPNLLEPPSERNGNRGVGKMVFLLADDDGEQETYGNLTALTDTDWVNDGVPDYDVSAYDPRGLPTASNPDEGVSAYDRTVDLGEIEGGKEVIFFIIVYYDSNHQPDIGTVFPCLKQDAQGRCQLHLRSPIKVFFTKSAWNMDQNPDSRNPVAERNIGCDYNDSCDPDHPLGNNSCHLVNNGPRTCGWLDGPKTTPGTTLHRLLTNATYGYLDMPMELVTVPRPGGTRNAMPHVIVGAPSTDPFRWILGFEDIPGGGDRDFNDVVFVINKKNGGSTRSATVSGDISPNIASDFVITKVRFRRQDDIAPAPRTCGHAAPCWSGEESACTAINGVRPTITYFVAVDCQLCTNGTCTRNDNPNWHEVVFPNNNTAREVELDMLSLGFTGSQLCWRVDVTSPNERCRPIIDNVDVGYQAVRYGSYSRSSPSSLGNARVRGVQETPGRAWGESWPGTGLPGAETRAYDDRKDFSVRGRLYFQSLYDPEQISTDNVVQRWEAGNRLALDFRNGMDPMERKLYTKTDANQRISVIDLAADDASDSPLFPDSLCNQFANGRWRYDLNNDDKCGTPSITAADKHVEGPTNDRNFMAEWLYGWEDRHAPGRSDVKRPWVLGGINLSTVALAPPPYLDSWALNLPPGERDLYRRNFVERYKTRDTVAYVGTMNGFLHAFDSGDFRVTTKDRCTTTPQITGLFEPVAGACVSPVTPREYGTGKELFAYLPQAMLERYRNLYVQFSGSGTGPQVDASPAIANVDFGIQNQLAWTPSPTGARDEGAKTVLVSATGKNYNTVFALDVTDPTADWYPQPLWEAQLGSTAMDLAFTLSLARRPDRGGSRHSPSVGRLAWGDGTAWAAVVGTDYMPDDNNRAGALYILDMKTGRPLNFGETLGGRYAGVITLDRGYGVAASTAMLDLNRDGTFDTLYVPTTMGNVYRINLDDVDPLRPLGRKVKTCKVASAPASLENHPDAADNAEDEEMELQQIHSNLGVRVIREGTADPVVRFYFGTSDNPDEFSDGPADKDNYRYHMMAYEDPDPDGSGNCELLEPLWVQPLDPGQTVWGGVALKKDTVQATTAVGTAADVCNLSEERSGRLYEVGLLPDANGNAQNLTSVLLGGHGTSAPMVHHGQTSVHTATGEVKTAGQRRSDAAPEGGARRTRTLIYDPNPEGRMPQ